MSQIIECYLKPLKATVHGMVLFYMCVKLSSVVETHSRYDETSKNNQTFNGGTHRWHRHWLNNWLIITFVHYWQKNPTCHHFLASPEVTSFMDENDNILAHILSNNKNVWICLKSYPNMCCLRLPSVPSLLVTPPLFYSCYLQTFSNFLAFFKLLTPRNLYYRHNATA